MLTSCASCPTCPPTTICPVPPKPMMIARPELGSVALKLGDSGSKVIKTTQDDLAKCLRYSLELEQQLNTYK